MGQDQDLQAPSGGGRRDRRHEPRQVPQGAARVGRCRRKSGCCRGIPRQGPRQEPQLRLCSPRRVNDFQFSFVLSSVVTVPFAIASSWITSPLLFKKNFGFLRFKNETDLTNPNIKNGRLAKRTFRLLQRLRHLLVFLLPSLLPIWQECRGSW